VKVKSTIPITDTNSDHMEQLNQEEEEITSSTYQYTLSKVRSLEDALSEDGSLIKAGEE
jgi:hypothetical protein